MEYFIVFCAAFVGSGLKAVGGFGFATLTTPTVSLFWDVPTAIVVISIPTLVTSLFNCWRTRDAAKEGFQCYPDAESLVFLVKTNFPAKKVENESDTGNKENYVFIFW